MVTDMRAPAPRGSFGTVCCHSCWQAPPMTMRSPPPGRNDRVGAPDVPGRSRNRLRSPSKTVTTSGFVSVLRLVSPCQATPSRPSR